MIDHAGKIAGKLAAVADETLQARDVYFALVEQRNELIYQLVDADYTFTEVAGYAGITREQVSKMVKRRESRM
ncbi:hypothetical protein ACU4IU_00215 [Brevibacterium sp. CSND-B09]|uniref:hypothetical protein n=1 Tax=Brevibacterium sp. CSND-B09 TaxID=3462571 RepID=UPI00406A6E3A